jgi:hypothetical protein
MDQELQTAVASSSPAADGGGVLTSGAWSSGRSTIATWGAPRYGIGP